MDAAVGPQRGQRGRAGMGGISIVTTHASVATFHTYFRIIDALLDAT
jgi:hypothetical protein